MSMHACVCQSVSFGSDGLVELRFYLALLLSFLRFAF